MLFWNARHAVLNLEVSSIVLKFKQKESLKMQLYVIVDQQ